jgi:photosystem II stability/assembly factor-like uncharacterized protein
MWFPISSIYFWEFSGFGRVECAADRTDPNTIYLRGGQGFAKTADGGANWAPLSLGNPSLVYPDQLDIPGAGLVIDPTNPATLYAPNQAGISKSTDGGKTWGSPTLGPGVNALAIDPTNPNVLYAATGLPTPNSRGLFKSTDGGANWQPINSGLDDLIAGGTPVSVLLVDPGNPDIVYAGAEGYGVFKSGNGGLSWSAFNDGLANLYVRTLAIGAQHIVYAGTRGGVFQIDEGADRVANRGYTRRSSQ